MKYAVIQFGGKQFKVEENDVLEIERQALPLKIETLLYRDDKETLLGDPVVEKATVTASVLEEKRARKVRVGRFKSKSRYRRVKGHKQPISVVRIDSITVGAVKSKKTAEKAETTKEEFKTKKSTPKKSVAKKPASKKETKTAEKKPTKKPTTKKSASKKTPKTKKSTKSKEDKKTK